MHFRPKDRRKRDPKDRTCSDGSSYLSRATYTWTGVLLTMICAKARHREVAGTMINIREPPWLHPCGVREAEPRRALTTSQGRNGHEMQTIRRVIMEPSLKFLPILVLAR